MQREIILDKAMELYLQFGLRSVSMDQIANELGISKKTIYRFFDSKSALVHEGILKMTDEVKCFTDQILTTVKNPIEEIFTMHFAMQEYFTPTHERMLFQLKKYFPETYRHLQKVKEEEIINATLENLKRGMKEGFYRDDFDPEVIARLYLGQAQIIMNDDFFWSDDLDKKELRNQALHYHLHGILSEKGRQTLEKLHKSNNITKH